MAKPKEEAPQPAGKKNSPGSPLKNPAIAAMVIFAVIAGIYLGLYLTENPEFGGIWDFDFFGNGGGQGAVPGGCPTVPDPPCWSDQSTPDEIASGIHHVVSGVYVYSHCDCPEGTYLHTELGATNYCQCNETA